MPIRDCFDWWLMWKSPGRLWVGLSLGRWSWAVQRKVAEHERMRVSNKHSSMAPVWVPSPSFLSNRLWPGSVSQINLFQPHDVFGESICHSKENVRRPTSLFYLALVSYGWDHEEGTSDVSPTREISQVFQLTEGAQDSRCAVLTSSTIMGEHFQFGGDYGQSGWDGF